MKYFTNRSQLARMDFNTRLIATFFLIFMLLGSGLSIFMTYQRTQMDAEGALAYYRGDEKQMLFAKEPSELIETTHFHLFIMPLIYLTTGHLFLLSAWSKGWKTFVISSCFVYILLDVAKPWLIRFVGAGFGVLAPFNSGLLGLTMLVCIGVPLYEMWFLADEPRRRSSPP